MGRIRNFCLPYRRLGWTGKKSSHKGYVRHSLRDLRKFTAE